MKIEKSIYYTIVVEMTPSTLIACFPEREVVLKRIITEVKSELNPTQPRAKINASMGDFMNKQEMKLILERFSEEIKKLKSKS